MTDHTDSAALIAQAHGHKAPDDETVYRWYIQWMHGNADDQPV